jgi:arginine/lysine/ornithine decarboxylase
VVVPGERLTSDLIGYLREVLSQGGAIRGASDPTLATVRVLAE